MKCKSCSKDFTCPEHEEAHLKRSGGRMRWVALAAAYLLGFTMVLAIMRFIAPEFLRSPYVQGLAIAYVSGVAVGYFDYRKRREVIVWSREAR